MKMSKSKSTFYGSNRYVSSDGVENAWRNKKNRIANKKYCLFAKKMTSDLVDELSESPTQPPQKEYSKTKNHHKSWFVKVNYSYLNRFLKSYSNKNIDISVVYSKFVENISILNPRLKQNLIKQFELLIYKTQNLTRSFYSENNYIDPITGKSVLEAYPFYVYSSNVFYINDNGCLCMAIKVLSEYKQNRNLQRKIRKQKTNRLPNTQKTNKKEVKRVLKWFDNKIAIYHCNNMYWVKPIINIRTYSTFKLEDVFKFENIQLSNISLDIFNQLKFNYTIDDSNLEQAIGVVNKNIEANNSQYKNIQYHANIRFEIVRKFSNQDYEFINELSQQMQRVLYNNSKKTTFFYCVNLDAYKLRMDRITTNLCLNFC